MLREAEFTCSRRSAPQSRDVMLPVRVGMEGQSFASGGACGSGVVLGGAMPDVELASPTTFFESGYRWASYL